MRWKESDGLKQQIVRNPLRGKGGVFEFPVLKIACNSADCPLAGTVSSHFRITNHGVAMRKERMTIIIRLVANISWVNL